MTAGLEEDRPHRASGFGRWSLLLIALFIVTRIGMVWFATHPDVYRAKSIVPASDVERLYETWADELFDEGERAYVEVPIEYPPGSLPFLLLPKVAAQEASYLTRFVAVIVAVDVIGLIGVWRLSRRWGSRWGPWLWVILLPALGPVVHLRLDLVPAVATVWAVERAAARDWLSSGGLLGFGIAAKLYPILFVPAAAIAATKRWKLLIGVTALIVIPLIPVITELDHLNDSVLGYHLGRGIQVESLWGSVLFQVMAAGGDAEIVFNFGALHFAGSTAATLKSISALAAAAAVGAGTLLAFRQERGARAFAEVSFVILALALSFGSVFSPQFLIWLFALGACVACAPSTRLRAPVLLLVPIALLTQAIFPWRYPSLLDAEPLSVALLGGRNVMVLLVAVSSGLLLLRRREVPSAPSTRAVASAGTR